MQCYTSTVPLSYTAAPQTVLFKVSAVVKSRERGEKRKREKKERRLRLEFKISRKHIGLINWKNAKFKVE